MVLYVEHHKGFWNTIKTAEKVFIVKNKYDVTSCKALPENKCAFGTISRRNNVALNLITSGEFVAHRILSALNPEAKS